MALYAFFRAYLLGCWVLIPTLIIALIMVRPAVRAIGMSLVFTAGGALGFALAFLFGLDDHGRGMLNKLPDTLLGNSMAMVYCCAAAIGGGVLALFVFNKFVRPPPGQHS